jgi:hypothetical protein
VRRLQRGRERRVEELTALLQGLGEAQLRALRAAAELLERLLGRDAGHD